MRDYRVYAQINTYTCVDQMCLQINNSQVYGVTDYMLWDYKQKW